MNHTDVGHGKNGESGNETKHIEEAITNAGSRENGDLSRMGEACEVADMTGMPGMADHPPMMIKAFTIEADKDGRALTLKLRKPLVAGDYDVKWSVVSADGKPLSGRWSFTAR